MADFEPSALDYALDNHAVASSGSSMFDTASDLVTKAAPLVARSIYLSFKNMPADVGNWFGGENRLETMDDMLQGRDDNLSDYYKEHAQGVEIAGLIVGSFVPGGIAVKGLKAVEMLNAAAKAGKVGENIARATGLFPSVKKAEILANAKQQILTSEGLYATLQGDTVKAVALGLADQALMAAAWETATIATMHASPVLNQDSFMDSLSHIGSAALVGGVIGGAVETLAVRSTLKKTLVEKDIAEKMHEFAAQKGIGDYLQGDKAEVLMDAVYADVLPADTAASILSKVTRRNSQAASAAQEAVNQIADDPQVGNAFFQTLLKMKNEFGMPRNGTPEQLGMSDYLERLAKVSRVNADDALADPDVFYLHVRKPKDANKLNWSSVTPDAEAQVSHAYKITPGFEQRDLRLGYYGDALDAKNATAKVALRVDEAWANDFDLWLDANDVIHINPNSPKLTKVAQPGFDKVLTAVQKAEYAQTGELPEELTGASMILNLKTGRITNRAYATVGDLTTNKLDEITGLPKAGSEISLTNESKGLRVKNQHFQFEGKPFRPADISPLEANAAYVWAAMRGIKKGDIIDIDNLPMLEALYHQMKTQADDAVETLAIRIRKPDGGTVELRSLREVEIELEASKRFALEGMLKQLDDDMTAFQAGTLEKQNFKYRDAADIATRANVPVEFIEKGLPVGGSIDDLTIWAGDHVKVNNVRLSYDLNKLTFDPSGNIARGEVAMQQRIAAVEATNNATAASFFGKEFADIKITNFTGMDATVEGAGGTFISSSNANVKTLAQQLQFVGKRTLDIIKERIDKTTDLLMSSHQSLLADKTASAELATLMNAMRRSGEYYTPLPSSLYQQFENLTGRKVAADGLVLVPRKAVDTDALGNARWDYAWQPDTPKLAERFIPANKQAKLDLQTDLKEWRNLGFYEVSPKVARYVRDNISVNDMRLSAQNNWYATVGMSRELQLGNFYVPPVDTRKYPFVAFVRQRQGTGAGTSTTTAVTAENAEKLQQKIAAIEASDPTLEVITKADLKRYFEARGDYDFNLHLVDNTIDTSLKRKGILSDFMPNLKGETALQEMLEWHNNMEARLVRNHVELANSQLFAEINFLKQQYDNVATSKVGFLNEFMASNAADNPYKNLLNEALGISKRTQYTLWNATNEKLEAAFTTAFNVARSAFLKANAGLIDFDAANKLIHQYGLGDAYGATVEAAQRMAAQRAYTLSSQLPPTPYLERFVRAANSIVTATAIRLDVLQNVVNAISVPVLLWPEAREASRKIAQVGIGNAANGAAITMPSTSKLVANSIESWFKRPDLRDLYLEKGLLKRDVSTYFDLVNDLTLRGGETGAQLTDKIRGATDKAAKWMGSDGTEQFVRFVAADVARQIWQDGAGLAGLELWANVNTFVNRVHGVTVAAQRPVLFQGPIGAAVGLFQTYQFNLLQQAFRYIGEGEYKAVMLMAGLQSGLYGLNGLPGFQQLNTHIIGNAANNPAHTDLYSSTKSLLGNDWGNLTLFGLAANLTGSGIYTRGDINPRQITVIPVNPADWPAVASTKRFIGNIYEASKKMSNGGNFWETFTQALEHNALSRPLTGLAQTVQGYSTTGSGALIARTDTSNLGGSLSWLSLSNMMRIAGARPLDEAVVMDSVYRKTAYQANDTRKVQQLGEAVRTALVKGQSPTDEQLQVFAAKYAAAGGRPENFGRHMIEWTKDVNTAVANRVYSQLQTPFIKNQQLVMGGVMLPDYTTSPITAAATPEPANVE